VGTASQQHQGTRFGREVSAGTVRAGTVSGGTVRAGRVSAGESGWAGLVDPGAGDAAAGVLGGGDRVLAAGTRLAGGAGRAGLRAERGVSERGVAGRA